MTAVNWQRVGLFLVLVAIWLALIAASLARTERDRSLIYQERERLLATEYRAVLQGYTISIALLLDELGNDESFLFLLELAGSPSRTKAQKAEIRRSMHTLLSPFYERMVSAGFDHLHIYLPNNHSFLRMHRVEQYGDDQTGFRWTVEVANREHRRTSGFEIARIVHGYRAVRPVFHAGQHVGAVDIGISIERMLDQFQNLFDEKFHILLSRDRLEEVSLAPQSEHYPRWPVHESYMLALAADSLDAEPICPQHPCVDYWRDVSRQFNKGHKTAMAAGQGMTFSLNHLGHASLVSFLPLHQPGRPVEGYLVSIEPSSVLVLLADSQRRQWIGYTLAILLAGALGIFAIEHRRRLQHLAWRDQLTGLFNRRMFLEFFQRARLSQVRDGKSLALIMGDLDHFKHINDQWGHQTGDEVLVGFARVLEAHVRRSDLVARWGGEEFILLLRDANIESGERVAETLREATQEIAKPDGKPVTVSFGVLGIPASAPEADTDSLLAWVDKLLYRAKNEGRNRVITGSA